MSDATIHDHELDSHAMSHEHVGSVHLRLVLTFLGGVMILNAYLAEHVLFPDDPVISGISALIGVIILATPIIIAAIHEIAQGRMHMSVLVAIAIVASCVLEDPQTGDVDYKVGGIVAFFMLLATLIEQQTAAGARESVEKLMTLTPPTAELENGKVVPVSELEPGDRVRVRPGDRVPADGVIASGDTTLDEATITGESVPVDKAEGTEVFAGTTNLTGSVSIEVTRVGEDTTLGKVKTLILEAEQTRTPMMQMIDRYAEWYTPVVLMIAAIVWIFTKEPSRAIAAIVVACPCAFVLATPTAMVAGLSAAARLGILIKQVAHLEAAGDITAMVFDKTGTLTTGELTVTRMVPAEGVDGAELLLMAASLEQHSRHPVAQAVTRIARRANVPLTDVTEFQEVAGRGVVGQVGESQVAVGRTTFLAEQGVDTSAAARGQHLADSEGMSMLYVARDGRFIGWIGLEDRARPEAKKSTQELRDLGVRRLSMVTGDRWTVAKKVAGELGCTDVQGECLPEQKLRLVEMLREEDHLVAVVGDGVNDAPALAAGDLGIAMGAAGSDVAINSASIALMSDDLERLPFLVRLSRKLRVVIIQNLLMGAVFVLGGLLLSSLGWMPLILAAILHNVSSFIVIFNSARLVRFGEHLAPHAALTAEAARPAPAVA